MLDNLPLEVLSKVLSFLPLHDRLECCLVCKKFIDAYENLPRDLKHEAVVMFDSYIPEDVVQVFKSPSRTFTNLVIDDVNMASRKLSKTSENFISKVRSLTWNTYGGIFPKWELLSKLPRQLESISIMYSLSSPILAKLEPDEIAENPQLLYMSQYQVGEMMVGPIKFINIVPKIWDRMDRMSSLTSIEVEGCLCTPDLMNLIRRSKMTLKVLTLKRSLPPADSFLIELSTLGLKLHSLNLYSYQTDGSAIIEFLKTQTDLDTLNLGEQTPVFHKKNSIEVFKNLKKVTQLSLEFISMRGFDSCLGHMRLKNLNLSCSDILSSEVLTALSLGNFNLRSLNMDKFYIPKENLIKMIPLVPNLVELNLNGSDEEVDDEVMWEISRQLTKLKVLNLGYCKKITNQGFIGDLENSTTISNLNLDTLNVSDCRIDDESCLKAFKFRYLTTIDLTGCSRITKDGLIAVTENNPLIRVLKIDDSWLDLDDVAKIIKPLSRLRLLEMYHGFSKTEAVQRKLALKDICSEKKLRYVFVKRLGARAVM